MPSYPLEVHDLFIPTDPAGMSADEQRVADALAQMSAAVERMRAEIAAAQAAASTDNTPQEP